MNLRKIKKYSNKILKDLAIQDDYVHLEQAIKSNLILAELVNSNALEEIESSPRDRMMAENIMYYIKRYSKEKMIISTSTYHLTFSNSENQITLVDYLPDSIIKQSMIVPIIYYSGVKGVINSKENINFLETVKRGANSLEKILYDIDSVNTRYYNIDYLINELNISLDKVKLESMLSFDKSIEIRNFTGIIFIPKMNPVEIFESNKPNMQQIEVYKELYMNK